MQTLLNRSDIINQYKLKLSEIIKSEFQRDTILKSAEELVLSKDFKLTKMEVIDCIKSVEVK